jgi:hypothetical protein
MEARGRKDEAHSSESRVEDTAEAQTERSSFGRPGDRGCLAGGGCGEQRDRWTC